VTSDSVSNDRQETYRSRLQRGQRGAKIGRVSGLFAGLATVDLVYRVAAVPGPDEKVTALSQDLAAGGPAANAAVTFAALGGRARLLTALGSHPLARFAAGELASQGVEVLDLTPDDPRPPTVSSVYVAERSGARSVVSANAAGRTAVFPEEHTLSADVVLADGHHPEIAVGAARWAREQGIPVVLDGGSWKPVLERLLPLTDVAICSADFRFPGRDDTAEAVAERGPELVAVTAGAGPVRWRDGRERGEVAVPVVEAVDTLGAGDVFHGAFAYAWAAGPGQGFADALAFAGRVAALRCSVRGPRTWIARLAGGDL
jgi:sulfofructose kinase